MSLLSAGPMEAKGLECGGGENDAEGAASASSPWAAGADVVLHWLPKPLLPFGLLTPAPFQD